MIKLRSKPILFVFFFACLLMGVKELYALPEGCQVVEGAAEFDTSVPNTLTVRPSDNAVINYDSFNIAQNESVYFYQPSANSNVLNNVIGSQQSNIAGYLYANGNVFIVNPNGIVFDSHANINAGSLAASTMNIDTNDFRNGNFIFRKINKDGRIVNQAIIKVNDGGFIALLAQTIKNEGMLEADQGTVALAGGNKATLSFEDNKLIQVAVEDPLIANPAQADAAIVNKGIIQADSGKIILTASAARDVFTNAVNNEGIVRAGKTIENPDGTITLLAPEGDIKNSGVMSASGDITIEAQKGDIIELASANITAEAGDVTISSSTGNITVSGISSGGKLDIFAPQGRITQLEGTKLTTVDKDILIDAPRLTLYDIETAAGHILIGSRVTPIEITGLPHYIHTAGDIEINAVTSEAGITTLGVTHGDILRYATTGAISLEAVSGKVTNISGIAVPGNTVKLIGNQIGSIGEPFIVNADITHIYRNIGDIDIAAVIDLEGDQVTIAGPVEGFGAVTYCSLKSLTLEAQNGGVTDSGQAIIPASTLTIIGSNIGHHTQPVITDADTLHVRRTNKDIVIALSSIVGDGVTVRGPPDDDFAITYLKDSDLSLESQSGGVFLSQNSYLEANNLTLRVSKDSSFGYLIVKNTLTISASREGVNPVYSLTGDIVVSNLIINNCVLDGGNAAITLSGSWSNLRGSFEPDTSTVVFYDASKISAILGDNTFYNFTCLTPCKTIVFEANTLTTIQNTLTIEGSEGIDNYVTLESSIADKGNEFGIYINFVSDTEGNSYVEYINVCYSHAYGPLVPIPAHNYYIPAELNIDWDDTHTWTGTTSGSWSVGTNWGGTAPVATDSLTFPAGALNLSTSNNFVASTSFATITISGSGYTLAGNSITVSTAVTDSTTSGASEISLNMAFAATRTITVTNAAETLTISGVISGAGGVTKAGSGNLALSRTNTYAGTTTINAGTLQYGADNVIAAGNVTVSGGTLNIVSYSDTVGTVTLTSGTITGTTGVLTGGANYAVKSGTISAILGGAVGLTKDTAGTVTVTSANTYTGTTTISVGVLNIQNASALGTTAGATSITSGAALQIQGGITITGKALTLNGTGVSTDGALRNISGNNTWTGSITLGSTSRINSDAGTLTISGNTSGGYALTVGGVGNTTISGVIGTGAGTFTKDGAGTLIFSGVNTYTGLTTISAGTLQYGADNVIAAGNVTVSGGTLNIVSYSDTVGTVTLTSGTITGTTGVLTGGANYAVKSGTISAILGGAVGLTKDTAGTVTVTSANTYTGTTTISVGVLNIQNASALGTTAGATSITSGAALQIQGGITVTGETLTINGTGITSTGALRSISGNNTWTGSITLGSTGSIGCDAGTLSLSGTITCASYGLTFSGAGSTTTPGSFSISGALSVNTGASFTVSAGTIILNNGVSIANSGTLTFYNLTVADSAAVTASGSFDVTQTFTIGASAAFTPGAGVVINNAAAQGTITGQGTIKVTRIAATADYSSQYKFTTNTLTNLTVDYAGSGDQTINVVSCSVLKLSGTGTKSLSSTTLDSSLTVSAGTLSIGAFNLSVAGTVTLSGGTITGTTGVLTSGVDYALQSGTISAILGGAVGLTKSTSGTATITSANTYTGTTSISEGVLNIQNALALGTTAGATSIITSGAALQIQGGITVTGETLTLRGAGISSTGALRNISGNNTWTGNITMTSGFSIGCDAGTLTVSGVISGSYALTKVGAGILALSGTNTYNYITIISAGVLNIQNASALGATGGETSITSGAALQIQGGITVREPLTIKGTGISSTGALRSISGNNTWTGNITLGSTGSVGCDADTLTLSGTITCASYGLTFSGAGSTTTSGSFTVAGALAVNAGASFTASTGTITLNNGASIANLGTLSFYNLTLANSAVVTASGSFDVTQIFTIGASSAFIPGAGVVINNAAAQGTITGQGTIKVTRIAATADYPSQYKFTTNTLTNLTVDYAGSGDQTINVVSYGNLKISGSGIKSLAGNTTVSGGLTVTAGTLAIGTYDLTLTGNSNIAGGEVTIGASGSNGWTSASLTLGVAGTITCSGNSLIGVTGDWTNSGGVFTKGTSTVNITGSGNSTITGSTEFYNFSCISAGKTLNFGAGSTQTMTGALTITGAAGNKILLRSASSPTQWKIDPRGARVVSYVDVKDSNNINAAVITPVHFFNSGNNTNWDLLIDKDFSGVAYLDKGVTNIGAGKTVAIAINGAPAVSTDLTDSAGRYTLTTVDITDGDMVLIYLEDETENGAAVSKIASDEAYSDFDIYRDAIIARCDYLAGTSITNANLAAADNADTDINYSVSGGNLALENSNELLVWPGDIYEPCGNISAYSIDIRGTLSAGSNSLSIANAWSNTGTFTCGTSTVTFNGSVDQIVTTNGSAFYNLILNNTGVSGNDDIIISGSLDVNGALTITNGDLDVSTNDPNVNIAGNMTVGADGTIDISGYSGVWTFDGSGTSTLTDNRVGVLNYGAVTVNGTAKTLQFASSGNPTFTFTVLTIGSDDTVYLNGKNTAIATLVNNGTFKLIGSETTAITNMDTDSGTMLYAGDGDSATDTYTVKDFGTTDYYNLTINSTDGAADTFRPSNANLNIAGNFTLTAGAFTTNDGSVDRDIDVGGNWDTSSGTFICGTSTVTFDAATTGKTIDLGAQSFYNVTFNGVGGGWILQDALTIDNDLVISAGTLSGEYDVTVDGGDVTGNGTINLINGTFLLDGAGSFGGDSSWTFYNLVFGDGVDEETTVKNGSNDITCLSQLTVSSNHRLEAGANNWNLSWAGTETKLTDISQIAASYDYMAALKNDGSRVYTWGSRVYTWTSDQATPVEVLGLGGIGYLGDGINGGPISQIAAGEYSMFALKSDGSRVYNLEDYIPVEVLGIGGIGYLGDGIHGGPISQIAAYAALKSDGSRVYNLASGIPVEVLGIGGIGYLGDGIHGGPISYIACGYEHLLALKSDGSRVYAWGKNDYGKLGDGTTTNRSNPVEVLGIGGIGYLGDGINGGPISQIAAGRYLSVALKSGGSRVYTWGRNSGGALGNDTIADSSYTPIEVLGLGGVGYLGDGINGGPISQIAVGYAHVLALKSGGSRVYAWGYNDMGALGDNTTDDRSTPIEVLGVGGVGYLGDGINGGPISQMAATTYYTAALQSGNGRHVYAWGYNCSGQLGNNSKADSHVPVEVLGIKGEINTTIHLDDISQMASCLDHVLALKSDGSRVYAWGGNLGGNLGDGTSETSHSTPVMVLGLGGVGYLGDGINGGPISQIAAGDSFSLALKSDGSRVYAWGWWMGYELTPAELPGVGGVGYLGDGINGGPISYIACGWEHALAVKSDGSRVYTWGDNFRGSLGNNHPYVGSGTPVEVLGLGGVGYLGDGINGGPISKVVGGNCHSLALKSDGSRVYAWGGGYEGQLGNGTTDDSYVPIEVLGLGGVGYLGDGINGGPISQIVAGEASSLALKSDGSRVYAWGSNWYGHFGDNTETRRTTPIEVLGLGGVGYLGDGINGGPVSQIATVGGYSTVALKSDGSRVYACGYNDYGELGDGTTTERHTFIEVLGLGGVGYLGDGINGGPISLIVSNWEDTLALKSDGNRVYAWGRNDCGELGNGSEDSSATPVETVVPTYAPLVINGTFNAQTSVISYPLNYDYMGAMGYTIIAAADYCDLTADNPNSNYFLAGAVTVENDFTNSGVFDITANNYGITVAGDWTNTGTFMANAGTVTFNNSTGTQTIDSGDSSFYNLTHSGAGILQLTTNDLTVTGALNNSSGTLDLNGNNLTVGGTFTIGDAAVLKLNGDETISSPTLNAGSAVEYSAASGTRDIRGWTYTDIMVKINGAGGTFTLPADLTCAALNVTAGTLEQADKTITAGSYGQTGGTFNGGTADINITDSHTFTVSGGTYVSTSGILAVAGDFDTTGGTFIHNSGTVEFNGLTGSVISGDTTFYNLISTTAGKTLEFETGSAQTTTGMLTLTGAPGSLITLDSASGGVQWKIDPQGAKNISYVYVKNSNNISGIVINPANSIDGGNNINWFFTAAGAAAASTPPLLFTPASNESSDLQNALDYRELLSGLLETLLSSGDIAFAAEASQGFDYFLLCKEPYETYSKPYIQGLYRTTVKVLEGKVGVTPYDKNGADYKEETVLSAGQELMKEGIIFEEGWDKRGFDYGLLYKEPYETYSKPYIQGLYRTTVKVLEGKVGVAPYDKDGANHKEEVILSAGQDMVKEGIIFEEGIGKRGFDHGLLYKEPYEIYGKPYIQGLYRTTVKVLEGKVGIAPYDENGADYKEETVLSAGQKLVREGIIFEEGRDKRGFDYFLLYGKRDKYAKPYMSGVYRTKVSVFEGKVAVASYNENGPDYENAKTLTGGQKTSEEGVIANDESVFGRDGGGDTRRPLNAGPIIWTGAKSTEWTLGANWDSSRVPRTEDDVIITAGAANYPILDNSMAVKSLTIDSGCSLDLNGKCLSATTAFMNKGVLKLTGDEIVSTPTLTPGSTVEYTAESGIRAIKNWTYDEAIVVINGNGGTFTLPADLNCAGLKIIAGVLRQGTYAINAGALGITQSGGTLIGQDRLNITD